MGLIGEYIDGLSEEARSRIVRAQNWMPGALDEPDGSGRCLLGHAADVEAVEVETECALFDADLVTHSVRARDRRALPDGAADAFEAVHHDVGYRFDGLCERLGTEEAVRLVKRRAGWTPPEELTSEPVERGEALVPA